MFLAIINDTYSEVKSDIALQKSEFEITDYFKKGYEKMVGKLNFKRDKISDIQEALAHADQNADQHLDFDEWRQELKWYEISLWLLLHGTSVRHLSSEL